FEAVGLPWWGDDYRIALPDAARARAAERWSRLGVRPDETVIGLNVGAGEVYAYKAWRTAGWAELADRIDDRGGARVALLGGPRDPERIEAVAAAARTKPLDPGATASILDFAAGLERCAAIVTGATLRLPLGLAPPR